MLPTITPILNGSKFIKSKIPLIREFKVPFEHILVDGRVINAILHLQTIHSEV